MSSRNRLQRSYGFANREQYELRLLGINFNYPNSSNRAKKPKAIENPTSPKIFNKKKVNDFVDHIQKRKVCDHNLCKVIIYQTDHNDWYLICKLFFEDLNVLLASSISAKLELITEQDGTSCYKVSW